MNKNFLDEFEDLSVDMNGVRIPQIRLRDEDYLSFNISKDKSSLSVLNSLCKIGMESRIKSGQILEKNLDAYRERFKTELEVIVEGEFVDYFILLWDIIRFTKEKKICKGASRGCFTPESLVQLSDGTYKEIQNIKVGDSVIDAFGKDQIVLDRFIYDIEEDIVEIELQNGNIIKCTKDHKILTQNRGWVEAQHITHEDDLVEIKK